jgi:hypothetical protein
MGKSRTAAPSKSTARTERFQNKGTTQREMEVTRLVRQRLFIVKTVRFAESGMNKIHVALDFNSGGHVGVHWDIPKSASAEEQANLILKFVNHVLSK